MPASVTATMPSTLSALSSPTMIRGKASQTSRVCLAGVFFEQKSRILRRSGDPKTMRCQRRRTCTSIRYGACTKKSNISSRTSSGKLAGWLTSPGLHRTDSVSSCRGMSCRLEGRTSTVIHCQLISRQSNDVHDCLRPTSFQNGKSIRIDDPGCEGNDVGRRAMQEYGGET